MVKCKICNTEFETLDELRRHNSRVHGINSQETYNEYVLNNNVPTCKCGCGETPSFKGFTKGYTEWIRGHIARVKNNWGHNPTAIKNSSKTRREQYKNGERQVWNKGLTKDTDKRVLEYSLKGQETILNNPDEIERRRKWLSDARKYKKEFQSKYGKESANWKGGYSSICTMIYANKQLYDEWKYPKLVRSGFKCEECGGDDELHVHHNDEQMSSIVYKFIDKTKEYSWTQKRQIMEKVVNYHIENNVSGEVLCRECHKKHHPSYNF